MSKDGGPAFPQNPSSDYYLSPGMTLRDYFAGQALVGWLSSLPPDSRPRAEADCRIAYEYADAMIRAREAGDE